MLEFRELSACYGSRRVLDQVSFSIQPNRLTVLVGCNGSGKSTLFSCVNQQLPYTGKILLDGENLARYKPRERAKRLSMLPQTMAAPHILAAELAAMGRTPYLDLTGRLQDADRAAVTQALEDANALELRERYVDTLSGGERQRAYLAMVLAQNTPLILLDEPTSHMDQTREAAFLRQISHLKSERGKTFLLILHDITLAAEYADDIVILHEGRIRFAGTKADCLRAQALETTFGLRRYRVDDGQSVRDFFTAK